MSFTFNWMVLHLNCQSDDRIFGDNIFPGHRERAE